MMLGGKRNRGRVTADPKKQAMESMSRMARKRGTANDWVNQVLDGAIRAKFTTPSEREAAAIARGGETRHQRQMRLSHLYDTNSSAKLVRRRAATIREPVQRSARELAMKDYNPYGTLDGGPVYEEERKEPKPDKRPWTIGYRNSTTQPPVSPMAKASQPWLEKRYGTVLTADIKRSAELPVAEPWTPALTGSPHLWPKDSDYVAGSRLKTSTFCQPFRPSSRLPHMSYAALHSQRGTAGVPHPLSMANSRGPARDFMAGGGAKVGGADLMKRQPGENPIFATGSVLDRLGSPEPEHSPAVRKARTMNYVDAKPDLHFDDAHARDLRDTFRSKQEVSGRTVGLPQGGSPGSTLRDGDSYVVGSPGAGDDDAWTWDSEIGGPAKRLPTRLLRWQERQAKAEVDAKRSIRRKQRRKLKMERTKSAPAPLRTATRSSSTRTSRTNSVASAGSGASRRSRKKKKYKVNSVVAPRTGLKYWTNFTVMYSTRQDEKSIKATAEKRANERELRAKIKWRELGGLFTYLRMPSRRKAGVDELKVLYASLRKACAELGTEASITRDRFWMLISASELPQQNANRLFSGFDVDRKDEMDIRKFMCSVRLFKKPNEPLVDKLSALFDIFHVHSATENLRRADVVSLLQVCADREMEMDMIEKLALRAMNNKLGTKSVWAMDVSREAFVEILNTNEMLMSAFQNQYNATVGAV